MGLSELHQTCGGIRFAIPPYAGSSFTLNNEPALRTSCPLAQSAVCNRNLGWMRWWR